jgi:hypothetical protein
VIDRGRFAPTEEGTPQGGVISPLLLNIALHGLEQAAGCKYSVSKSGREPGATPGTPVLVRYADICPVRHRPAYAACRVMPTAMGGSLMGSVPGPEAVDITLGLLLRVSGGTPAGCPGRCSGRVCCRRGPYA